MRVRYRGFEYPIYYDGDKERFRGAIFRDTKVPVDQQILYLGTTPFEKIIGPLPENSIFTLRSRSIRNYGYNINILLELTVKDKYDNAHYCYVRKEATFSVLKSRLDQCDDRLVTPSCLHYTEETTLNEETTFYRIPKNAKALFVTMADPFAKGHTKTYCVYFKNSTTVLNLKQQIEPKTGFQTRVQSLKFGNTILEDDKTIDSYELQDGSTLEFAFRLEYKNYKAPNNCLIRALKYGALDAAIIGACSAIFNLLSRVHIPKEMVPSVKVCIAISITAGILSGIAKYNYNAPER